MNIIFCYYAVNTFSFHTLISNKPTPSAPQPLPEKGDLLLCSSNLVNRAAKTLIYKGEKLLFPHTVIKNVHGRAVLHLCCLQILKLQNLIIVRLTVEKQSLSNMLNEPYLQISLPQSLSPRVLTPNVFVVLCCRPAWQPIDQAID